MRSGPKLAVVPAALVAASLVFAGVAAGDAAPGASESGDSSDLPAGAQVLAGAVGSVTGTLEGTGDVDLYRFCAGDQGFTVSTVNAATGIDTQLFVFDGEARAVAFNDDRDATLQSRLSFAPVGAAWGMPAGEYLVAVGSYYNRATNAAGATLFESSIEKQVPAAARDDLVLAGWERKGRPEGAYRIDFTGTVDCTPAPASGPAGVGLDVRPGSDENPVNTRSPGRLPLALLGSSDLDVATVDPATVTVGPGGAALVGPVSLEDSDGDGHVDLVGHVRVPDLGLEPGDTELCADATAGTDQVHGCDAVRVR